LEQIGWQRPAAHDKNTRTVLGIDRDLVSFSPQYQGTAALPPGDAAPMLAGNHGRPMQNSFHPWQ